MLLQIDPSEKVISELARLFKALTINKLLHMMALRQ
jgi:hypothetical protein